MFDIGLNAENRRIPATVPERWGRMDALSRAALLAVGRVLLDAGLLDRKTHRVAAGTRAGLIAGTRHGCLATDLEYARTLAMGAQFASPALFGYTLPNIALAEAAVHYKLTGPVFSLYASDPFAKAVETAREWLASDRTGCEIIIAGELDMPPRAGDGLDAMNDAMNTNDGVHGGESMDAGENQICAHFTICHA